MVNDVTVFNIREYLSDKDDKILGEEELKRILSEFSCKKEEFFVPYVIAERRNDGNTCCCHEHHCRK